MKASLQRLLQKLLGYERYLWIFTLYKLKTLKWDKNENDFFHFLTLIQPNSIVLDIGANLGLMSYHLAKNNNRVIAFEPMPDNLKTIKGVKSKYKLTQLEILPLALGNETKKINLVLPVVEGVKKQGLSHVVDSKMTEFNEGKLFEAQCYKLDELEQTQDLKIDAIKIDVENFEYEVFLGAEQILKKNKPIIYSELWDNQNRLDCFEFLKQLGYSICVYTEGRLKEIQSNPSNIQNFFFVPKHA